MVTRETRQPFRVVLPSDYDEDYSKNSKLSTKKFIVGDYYDRI